MVRHIRFSVIINWNFYSVTDAEFHERFYKYALLAINPEMLQIISTCRNLIQIRTKRAVYSKPSANDKKLNTT